MVSASGEQGVRLNDAVGVYVTIKRSFLYSATVDLPSFLNLKMVSSGLLRPQRRILGERQNDASRIRTCALKEEQMDSIQLNTDSILICRRNHLAIAP